MNRNNDELEVNEVFGPETLMVFPTDTVYGIGGNGLEKSVIDRTYRVKQRSRDKPLTLHLFSVDEIEKYVADITEKQRMLIEELLPGPFTFIMPASPEAPEVSIGPEKKVGIRVPDSDTFRELQEMVDYPLVGTSVNKSGELPMCDFDRIVDKYGGLVDLFIEADEELGRKASTILDVTFDPPKVLRGTYPEEDGGGE
ncbi:MAG: L-threonylcarbamoyladenylate synthase [Candidatus Bipolaricaulota bacterium]